MYSSLKQNLEGCVYTVFTPFDENEKVDFEALEKYLTHLHNGGATKFYVMAYNSRYSQMTDSEILELNEFTIKTVKRLNSENIAIVADPIHCSTKVSTEFARHAKDCGADAVVLMESQRWDLDFLVYRCLGGHPCPGTVTTRTRA